MSPTASSCHHIQTAVIGAGVVGLSIARALSQKGHEVLILDQSNAIGSGISSRNSEVIHAGIYYDRSTMPFKSKFCVEGKKMLYDYCRERELPYRRCGKLLVATDEEQRDVGLPQLIELARANGVDDLRLVSKEDIYDSHSDVYEPNVVCEGAVFSPSTGIVDSHSLMLSLLGDAEEHGATLALHCQVQGGRKEGHQIILRADGVDLLCDNVVVSAGLASDKITSSILSGVVVSSDESGESDHEEWVHGSSKENDDASASILPRQYYAKGNYFKLENQKSPFGRLIYPLPDPRGGLGVHATIDLSNSTRFGPDVEWLDPNLTESEELDMSVDPDRADLFYDAIRKYWPDLEQGNLVPDYAGIRPKLVHPDDGSPSVDFGDGSTNLKDFYLKRHGALFALLGIESPGLTSSLAIGDYVANTIDNI